MSEGGEPGTDVRSFLPRPGEPVADYAQRLRALHRDLTLVLDAVERGLAAAAEEGGAAPSEAGRPAAERARAADGDGDGDAGRAEEGRGETAPGAELRGALGAETPVEIRPVGAPPHPGAPSGAEGDLPPAGAPGRRPGARVEVMPAPSGERRRADAPDRREAQASREGSGEPGSEEPATAPGGPAAPPRPPRFPPRPSEAAAPAVASDGPGEPRWVERAGAPAEPPPARAAAPADERFTAPQFPPAPPPVQLRVPPALVAALVAGWLTVVALLLALLLS